MASSIRRAFSRSSCLDVPFTDCLVDEPIKIRYDIEITGISRKGPHMSDEQWMREALALAREAAADGEVPVGCVVTHGERIVGRGRNRRECGKSALAHAELEAIAEACKTLGGWRLWQCALYVTLEPCPMCAGAILNAHIPRVVWGAADPKTGAAGSLVDLLHMPGCFQPEVTSGVLSGECAALLTDFFRALRRSRAEAKKGIIDAL